MIASVGRRRPLVGLLGLWHTTIGKKVVMAISGFILFLYVLVHMWGNLKIYQGCIEPHPCAINEYGVFLREVGNPLFANQQLLWLVRVILLVAVILHIWAAISLTQRDLAARPTGYKERHNVQANYASLTMRWGGVIILLFVIFHVLDLTTGTVNSAFVEGDIYNNVVSTFSRPIVSLFYILAMAALGMHLYHGLWSMFQTLGLNSRRSQQLWRNFAIIAAVILVAGDISIPIAVMAGLIQHVG
jgi:succinate dehydrogenase / fumarate reductase cytochrome b subunit